MNDEHEKKKLLDNVAKLCSSLRFSEALALVQDSPFSAQEPCYSLQVSLLYITSQHAAAADLAEQRVPQTPGAQMAAAAAVLAVRGVDAATKFIEPLLLSGVYGATHLLTFCRGMSPELDRLAQVVCAGPEAVAAAASDEIENTGYLQSKTQQILASAGSGSPIVLAVAASGLIYRNPVAALPAIRSAIEFAPEIGALWHNLGVLLMELSKLPASISALRRARLLSPGPATSYALAAAALRQRDASTALRLSVVSANESGSAAPWVLAGVSAGRLGALDLANQLYDAADRTAASDEMKCLAAINRAATWANLGVISLPGKADPLATAIARSDGVALPQQVRQLLDSLRKAREEYKSEIDK